MVDELKNEEQKNKENNKEKTEKEKEMDKEIKIQLKKSKEAITLARRIKAEKDESLKKILQKQYSYLEQALRRELVIKIEGERKNTSRKIKLGANLEAIFGAKEPDEMLETIFKLLISAKEQNLHEFMETPFDVKASILERMETDADSVEKALQLKGNQKKEIENMVRIRNNLLKGGGTNG